MKKELIGIFICMLLFFVPVLPATSNQAAVLENIIKSNELPDVTTYFFCRVDISGKGVANKSSSTPLLFWVLVEGTISINALFSIKGLRPRLLDDYTSTEHSAGILYLFRGNMKIDPETETIEIHGRAVISFAGLVEK